MIEKLEYWTGGTNTRGVINWQHHPNLDDIVDKVNELIEKINELERIINESKINK